MIENFTNKETRWLSNMSPCSINIGGVNYASTEHAYMSEKSHDTEWKKYCKEEKDPKKVKVKSGSISIRKDWDLVKVSVMENVIRQKFN